MNVAIVSTSVNPQPKVYEVWAKQGDLIVAGDHNSPPQLRRYVDAIGGRYLTPEQQARWPFSEIIGWNCVQRRNAAVMQAYVDGYDHVATVDDDNLPTDDWVEGHVEHLTGNYSNTPGATISVYGDEDWVDIGQFNTPRTRQRGTPLGVVRYHNSTRGNLAVVVSTAQVLGSPDCDAITRIVDDPTVTGITANVIPAVDQWAVFNSQATLWNGRWAPFMACLPGVGRYDDILASIVAKWVMRVNGVSFYAGAPCVTQDRNPHDPVVDLRAELLGMQLLPYVVRELRVGIPPDMAFDHQYATAARYLTGLLPEQTTRFMHSWAEVWGENRR